MSKTEFMNDLSQKLDKLTQADREEYMSFFSELIDDKIEEGYAEMSALESLGDAEELAQTILTSVPVTLNPKTEYIENHTVIDCTNRYRDGENLFRFTIKNSARYRSARCDYRNYARLPRYCAVLHKS